MIEVGVRVAVINPNSSHFNTVGRVTEYLANKQKVKMRLGELETTTAQAYLSCHEVRAISDNMPYPAVGQTLYSVNMLRDDLPVLREYMFIRCMTNPGATAVTWEVRNKRTNERILGSSTHNYFLREDDAWKYLVSQAQSQVTSALEEFSVVAKVLTNATRQVSIAHDRLMSHISIAAGRNYIQSSIYENHSQKEEGDGA